MPASTGKKKLLEEDGIAGVHVEALSHMECVDVDAVCRPRPSLPTRRSSDLGLDGPVGPVDEEPSRADPRGDAHRDGRDPEAVARRADGQWTRRRRVARQDRKSTRLNASHSQSSYAGVYGKKKIARGRWDRGCARGGALSYGVCGCRRGMPAAALFAYTTLFRSGTRRPRRPSR